MAAPHNNKGLKSDKEWRDAIRRAVHEVREGEEGSEKRLFLLARKLVSKAEEGDIAALKEIGDRLDGKPKQQVEVGGEGGGPLVISWKK